MIRFSRYLIGLFTITFLIGGFTLAQEKILEMGTPLSDELNETHLASVFLLRSNGDEEVTLHLTNEVGATLSLMLTNAWGERLAQVSGDEKETLLEIDLADAGNYYVTVLSAAAITEESVAFSLTRVGTAGDKSTEDAMASGFPSTQVLTNGLEIALDWDNTANLDLEIRDPVGGSLYFLNPSVPSGGSLPANRNGSCELLQSAGAELASWPAGILPSGSYEVLVYYQDDCEGLGTSEFSVDIRLNGTSEHRFTGSLEEGEVYLGRFVIRPDGSSTLGLTGKYIDPQVLTLSDWEESEVRNIETNASGTITNTDYALAHQFSAIAGDIATLELAATDGSLDTLLALYDPNGNLIAFNDDIDEGTNSAIRLRNLPVGGTYTVIASRYGGVLGGTEGNFTLTLNQQSSETVAELAALNLPAGDIEISLLWSTAADLQLLVRDPRGNSVYDDFPTTIDGGTLALAGNVGCSATLSSPVSHIYWPTDRAIPGWYEIDIWYQDNCGDLTPVVFTLYISVKGNLLYSANISIEPNSRYIYSFQLNLDGSAETGQGGIFAGLEGVDYQSQMVNASAIIAGQALGSILPNQPFQLYTFAGQAGDVVSISMQASAGTLDTSLYLIDPNGFVLGTNDDAVPGETTDSLLENIVLTQSGQHIILATRYGIEYGGTNGPYQLSLLIQ